MVAVLLEYIDFFTTCMIILLDTLLLFRYHVYCSIKLKIKLK